MLMFVAGRHSRKKKKIQAEDMHAYMCDVREYGACLWKGVPETLVLIKVGEDEARELWRDLERLGFQLSSLTLISRQSDWNHDAEHLPSPEQGAELNALHFTCL